MRVGAGSSHFFFINLNIMTINRVEELLNKQSFNAAEKAEIKAAADDLGIAYTIKQGCRNCYEKLLLQIYETLKAGGVVSVLNTSLDGWRFKNSGLNFRFFGELYSNETIKDKEIGRLNPFILSVYFDKVNE